jgi:hypothetical protein
MKISILLTSDCKQVGLNSIRSNTIQAVHGSLWNLGDVVQSILGLPPFVCIGLVPIDK